MLLCLCQVFYHTSGIPGTAFARENGHSRENMRTSWPNPAVELASFMERVMYVGRKAVDNIGEVLCGIYYSNRVKYT